MRGIANQNASISEFIHYNMLCVYWCVFHDLGQNVFRRVPVTL